MNLRPVRIAVVLSVAFVFAGCGIGRMFHHEKVAPAPNTDVVNPGRPLPVATSTPRTTSRKSSSAAAKPKPSVSKTTAANTAKSQFPTAKPVPGKPGLVFNPFKTNGSYIDVSGYAPGSKVKDPDTQKIFVVP
jgi:hypothetical protein